MSVVGTLAVKITGDNSNLEKSLKKSTADISAFAKKSALLVTATAGVFTLFAKRTIDSMDAMSKMAQQAGVSVETLSRLSYAADLSGVSTQNLVTSIGRLSKGMLEASQGTGEAKKAFEALGIDGGAIDSTDKALAKIADKFQAMPDGTEKSALAMQIFGRAGLSLIPLLNSGSEGLAKMGKEADILGKTFSTATAQAAERFNDNLTRLGAIGQGLTNQLMAGLLPALEEITAQMFNAYVETTSVDDAASTLSQNKLPEWVKGAGISFALFLDIVKATFSSVSALDDVFDGFGLKLDLYGTKFKRLALSMKTPLIGDTPEYLKKQLAELDSQIFELAMQTIDAEDKVSNLFGDAFSMSITDAVTKAFENAKVEIDPRLKKVSALPPAGASEASKKLAEEMKKEADAYSDFINDITGRTETARKAQEEEWLRMAKSIGDISAQEYDIAINKLRDVEDAMSQFAISAARNIQSALGDGIYNVLSGKFDDIGQSFLNMLNRMAADLISSQLSQLLFGNFGTTNKIGGLVGEIGGAIAKAFMGSTGGISYAPGNVQGSLSSAYGSMSYMSEGGYTGDGGKYEPAGIVHKGEYVLNAAATRRIGLDRLERMNKGFANGGYTGGSMPSGGVNINIKNEAGADGYKATAQARTNSDGGLNIDVLVRRVVSSDIQNNGALAQQMANTFGLRRSI